MNVTILLINGDPEIHATGCRDIARRAQHCSHRGRWTTEAASYTEIADEFACDFIDEGSMTQDDAVQWILAGIKPCVHGLPIAVTA